MAQTAGVGRGTVGGGRRVGHVGADVDDPGHPVFGGGGERGDHAGVIGQVEMTEVAVVVGPTHADQPDRRGKRGSPFSTVRPPG